LRNRRERTCLDAVSQAEGQAVPVSGQVSRLWLMMPHIIDLSAVICIFGLPGDRVGIWTRDQGMKVLDVCNETVAARSWQYVISFPPKSKPFAQNQVFVREHLTDGRFHIKSALTVQVEGESTWIYVHTNTRSRLKLDWTNYLAAQDVNAKERCRWKLLPCVGT
jgi:hypothetical protein